MEALSTPEFWIAVGQIIMIDILLGGDNAVVIALACRKLPIHQRNKGILWGTAGAIVLRVVLIFFALQLLAIPLLKIVGALLLVWIGVKLLLPEHEEGHGSIEGSDRLWGAVKTVIIADFVMSLDNVIAIAGAAEASGSSHSMVLVIFGVLVSIPIIVWGSQLVIKLMDRFPIIITLGGMLLGWIAGTMTVTDPALVKPDVMSSLPKIPSTDAVRYGAGIAGALLVLAIGKWLAARKTPAAASTAPAGSIPGVPRLQRVLLPVDGSEIAQRAVRHFIGIRNEFRSPESLDVLLLNVQSPVPGDVSSFVTKETLQEYHDERAEEALKPSRDLLQTAGVSFREQHRIGSPGPTIAEVAHNEGCDLVVMGTRGQGATTAALLGSVAQATIEQCSVPVMLVK